MNEQYKQEVIAAIKELQKIHVDSTDLCDDYFQGFYNGMEAIVSVLSGESPRYRSRGEKQAVDDVPSAT